MTVELGHIDWIALGAIATFLLALGTVWLGWQTRASVGELAEARIAQSLPALHWQRHPGSAGAGYRASGMQLEIDLAVLMTNVGPGPARLLEFDATTTNGEAWEATEIVMPSTLPAGERIELRLRQRLAPQAYPGTRETAIRVRYTDLANLRTYETNPRVTAHWTKAGAAIDAFDADERSPEERRIK